LKPYTFHITLYDAVFFATIFIGPTIVVFCDLPKAQTKQQTGFWPWRWLLLFCGLPEYW
jgi:hypothetical protein